MNSGRDYKLFGLLLIIVGAYALITNLFGASLKYIPWLALGGAFILLYMSKKKAWALVLGVLLAEYAMYCALQGLGFLNIRLSYVTFFFVPGTIFFTLFLTKSAHGFLIPGSFLLWAGVGLVLKSTFTDIHNRGALFIICIGMAFITVYLLGKIRSVKTYLYLGITVCVYGLYVLLKGISAFSLPKFGWVAIVILTIIMIITAGKNKK